MKLNHANLCCSDVARASRVFADHFAFEVVQRGKAPPAAGSAAEGADFALLRGGDGFFLVITQIDPDAPTRYPQGFHVGFMLEAADAVRAKHRDLEAAGWDPGPINSFEAMGATWTAFYCPIGDGIDIEVNAHS